MADKPSGKHDAKEAQKDSKPAAANILPDFEIPYYYEFLLDGTVSKENKPGVVAALDKRLKAAKEFLGYLETIESANHSISPVKNEQYAAVQQQLSSPIVEGKVFLRLNQDYNHTKYEVEDTKNNKKRMEDDVSKATVKAEEDKKNFHEAMKGLEEKSSRLQVDTISKLVVTDQSLLYHFDRANKWILDIYYDTPASKYAWDNFKKNIYTSDNGADLKSRIKGLYIPKLYDYQIESCQYINSTRPMFMKYLKDSNFDILLSTSEDIIKAYNARMDYTASKKVISQNKTKIIESNLDLQQSEKVSNSTGPYIKAIYDKLVEKELKIRLVNLSDFVGGNQNQHVFFKGTGGKVSNFLRAESLLSYGADEEERKKEKKGDEKGKKKDDKSKPAPAAPQKPGETAAPGVAPKNDDKKPGTSPVTNAKAYDTTFEMGNID